jgi:homoserine O-acetyltransferase
MNNTQIFTIPKTFTLEGGAGLQNPEIAYTITGNPFTQKVVWVFHALTANTDVMDWWSGLFGPDKIYDPREYCVVCANVLGSPYGSTSPQSLDFPLFTARDVVRAQILLAEHLGIERIHTLIGGSFGGHQALEFAYMYEGTVDHMVLVATAAKESAWGIAIHEAQRLSLLADPTFGKAGGGMAGMKAARAQAMLAYRTSEAFNAQQTDTDGRLDHYRAASYLDYQGEKFTRRFDPLCYYYLLKCLDTQDIGRERGGCESALQSIHVPTLIIGIESDVLIPTDAQKFLDRYLPNSQYVEITSKYGHDGFLVETEKITNQVRNFYRPRPLELREKRKVLPVFAFGKGRVGGHFINHLLRHRHEDGTEIKLMGVADSQRFYLDPEGLKNDWKEKLSLQGEPYDMKRLIGALKSLAIEGLVMVDNTDSRSIVNDYACFFRRGWDVVASNKAANVVGMDFYRQIQSISRRYNRKFLYETNVGAALPVLQALDKCMRSGDKILQIRAIASGSLSFLFNGLRTGELPFSVLLEEARKQGLTEPNPLMDLGGEDAARKLVIMAREIGMAVDLDHVKKEPVLPAELGIGTWDDYELQKARVDDYFVKRQKMLPEEKYWQYVGTINPTDGTLTLDWTKVSAQEPMACLSGSDNFFEIRSQTYQEQPLVIQGPGAGPEITAQGVYADLLRLVE